MSNWNVAINADLNTPEFAPREAIKDGSYPAIVSDARHEKFKSGSEGLRVTFTIDTEEYKKRTVNDYIILKKADGTDNVFGGAKAKRLALACGLTAAEINKFNLPPAGAASFGDLKKLLDQPVTIEVKAEVQKAGLHAGKTFARVNGFKAREEV